MARAVYSHELQDQDFSWLISRFQETNPDYVLVDSSILPLVLVRVDQPVLTEGLPPPTVLPAEEGDEDSSSYSGEQ